MMFEKEAEDNKPPYAFCSFNTDCELWKDGFQKGAEFGYNKANEWHYVKDGDLPKENEIVLFYTTYFDVWIGGIEPKNDKKHRWEVFPSVSCNYYAEDEVIAWKEIVLPKESE